MKSKRLLLTKISILITTILMLVPSISKAITLNPPLYFGITELRTLSTPSLGYAMGNPNANDTSSSAVKIWNIVKYSSSNFSDPKEVDVYCVKAGVGFSDIKKKAEYNLSFNMYTEREEIAKQNDILNKLVNGGYYNNLLALADLVYLPETSTEQEKNTLLENAGIYKEAWEFELSDDEIKAIQQAAMWYFTNYGEENNKYNKYDNTSWLWYTEDGSTYKNFSEYNPTNTIPNASAGFQKQQQAELLYKYLIDTANKNANNYSAPNGNFKTQLTLYASSKNNQEQPLMEIKREPQEFDLALRKYITKVNGVNVTNSRIPVIDEKTLEVGTTATYKHRKDPIEVKKDAVVTYNLTIYNEGGVDGRATKIVDQLPTGLKYSKINTPDYDVDYNEHTNILTLTKKQDNKQNLKAYTKGKIDSETIEIEAVVTSDEKDKVLTNVAYISEEVDVSGTIITNQVGGDRDSEPSTIPNVNKDNMDNYKGNSKNKEELSDSNYFYEGEQDDDDFEKLIVKKETIIEKKDFDLKLVKRIVEVNDKKVKERIQGVDITKLANGTATTADYQLNKEPISVKTGDLVKYTLRIYNEGEIDGYASQITEDIPKGLEFLGATIDKDMNPITDKKELSAVEYNTRMGWTYVKGDSSKITTDYLAKGKGEEITTKGANLIKAFDPSKPYSDEKNNKNPDYREVSVILKVVATDPNIGIIRNEAAITNDSDSEGEPVEDRDSKPEEWVKYEDDEDYDNVMLQEFDLALRKFITKIDEQEVTTRVPQPNYDKVKDKITYNHPKEPMDVVTGDIVTYTIRVYNEGDIDGYAQLVSDDIPDGLRFLPENETNIKYRWIMYDKDGKETEKLEEAKKITTDYLSKEQEEKEGENLLKAFNKNEEIIETNPDHRDIEVVFEVVEPNGSDKVIINSAQISEDSDKEGNPVEDKDSTPDKWVEGEDDQDKEYIKLRYFDLALRKWVTEAIVIEDGKQTVTQTGHTPEMDPEPVVKVELHRKEINKVTVKFRYSIRVRNEGDIAGYVKEITDYVPEGLKFVAADNPYWKDEGNNIISTTQLENTLLQPGESADVEVLLTWINSKDNMGLKTNIAEISKDYNDKGVADRDSTPDNKKPGEDDIDDAPVILSIETGKAITYVGLGLTVLVTIAGGIFLIKKYVI